MFFIKSKWKIFSAFIVFYRYFSYPSQGSSFILSVARFTTPNEKNLFPPMAKALRCLSQNLLSAAVFPAFLQHSRPPVLMHHQLFLIPAGSTKRAARKQEKRRQTSQTMLRQRICNRRKQYFSGCGIRATGSIKLLLWLRYEK